jgi:hypothetical protein
MHYGPDCVGTTQNYFSGPDDIPIQSGRNFNYFSGPDEIPIINMQTHG